MITEYLVNFFHKTPIKKIMLFLLCLIIFAFVSDFGSFRSAILEIFENEEIEINLTDHHFFYEMQKYLNNDIPNLPIKSIVKKNIFIDLLYVKVKIFYDNFYKFVHHNQIEKMAKDELHRQVTNILFSSVKEYKKIWKKYEIPEEVANKFHDKHSIKLEAVIISIDDVFETKIYTNNKQRMTAVLNNMSYIFVETIIDAERTLADFNGGLDTLKYVMKTNL